MTGLLLAVGLALVGYLANRWLVVVFGAGAAAGATVLATIAYGADSPAPFVGVLSMVSLAVGLLARRLLSSPTATAP